MLEAGWCDHEEEELDEVMKEADPDGSGQTDYKAFTTLMFKPV